MLALGACFSGAAGREIGGVRRIPRRVASPPGLKPRCSRPFFPAEKLADRTGPRRLFNVCLETGGPRLLGRFCQQEWKSVRYED